MLLRKSQTSLQIAAWGFPVENLSKTGRLLQESEGNFSELISGWLLWGIFGGFWGPFSLAKTGGQHPPKNPQVSSNRNSGVSRPHPLCKDPALRRRSAAWISCSGVSDDWEVTVLLCTHFLTCPWCNGLDQGLLGSCLLQDNKASKGQISERLTKGTPPQPYACESSTIPGAAKGAGERGGCSYFAYVLSQDDWLLMEFQNKFV